MARRTDYNGQTKVIAAGVAQTLVWTSSEIASERVIAYHFVVQGVGNDLTVIDRFRIDANGQNIVNLSPTQLRAYRQSYSIGAAIKMPTTVQAFTIPLFLPDAPQPDLQDVSQFPSRAQVQVSVVLNATAAAGSAFMGWTETNVAPVVFPRILGSVMNIPASVALQRFNFQENGVVRGILLPQTGIDRAKIVIAGQQLTNLPGAQFQGLANVGNMLLEAESLYGNGVSSAGTPLTTPAFLRVTAGMSAPVDGSYVELQTGAGWAGVTNELVTYAVAPNMAQAA